MCVQTSVMFTLLYVMRKCLFKDLHPTFCEVKYVYYLSFYWSMVWKKNPNIFSVNTEYIQWEGTTLFSIMSPFREYINASTLSDVMGDRSKSRTRLMYQEFQTLPRVIQYYWLSHQSQSHQQVSFLSLTVSDAVESLISFQYQEENMTKTTKTSKQICLYIGLSFFLAKRGWGERKKGYTL